MGGTYGRATPWREVVLGKNQWVVRHGDGWAHRGQGNSRATRVFDRQDQAINSARDAARREHSELLIQRQNGQIRERNSYGRDPFPPKG